MATDNLVLGFDYFTTLSGIAKIAEEIANFAGIISVAVGGTSPRGHAFLVCAFFAFIATACLLIFYVTQLASKFDIPWYKIELFLCGLLVAFYIIVSSLVLIVPAPAYMAGGIFGFIAVVIYGIDGLHKIKNIYYG
ncbi:hypothetical protein RI129_005403 [Pyrocoelia pectoralis]|uniref:MARVEL domain-containing protein n=1 Tax=Pyrocoelia pectoralis TaxID=417401 RepID=A0AAN7VND0_9COLE